MPERSHDLTGRSWVGFAPCPAEPTARRFTALDPRSGRDLEPEFEAATLDQVRRATHLAAQAARPMAAHAGPKRAAFLRTVAEELEADEDAIAARGSQETGLPDGRLRSELQRTTHQIRMFADLVEREDWRDPRIDLADPARSPTPKPDVRSFRRAIGPVVVFGASNFPLAFSVAGGDTVSALAAGCPVIVKAHPGHPGTSELVGAAIARAASAHELPVGAFALLFDDGHEVGKHLVTAPEVRAVAFTGSRAGGDALVRLANARSVPIPVYAEMGSVNPVFVLPGAARARGPEIASGLHASFTLGVGQFCTNPGVVLVPSGTDGNALVAHLANKTAATEAGTMLNPIVCSRYGQGLNVLESLRAERLSEGAPSDSPNAGTATLWQVDIGDVRSNPELLQEVFGPSTLVIRYERVDDLRDLAAALEGQLTATLHLESDEIAGCSVLVDILAERAGRVIVNQFPTGVEVGPAMVHGGPYPATSDGRSTSVGTRAIERFTRLVAYQNVPEELLPSTLR